MWARSWGPEDDVVDNFPLPGSLKGFSAIAVAEKDSGADSNSTFDKNRRRKKKEGIIFDS